MKCQTGKMCFAKSLNGNCTILTNTRLKDGECPFRKIVPDGPNEYDRRKKHEREVY